MTDSRQFDVFLSYNSDDRLTVERIALQLRQHGFTPWFDRWDLIPGGTWQDGIDQGLRASRGCAVCLGPHGFGPWQRPEIDVATDMATRDPDFRLFLVLLPGLPASPDLAAVPRFLLMRGWVDLHEGFASERQLQPLINALLGLPLGPGVPITPDDAESPYRGLEPFAPEHADYFFGRDAEVQQALTKLAEAPFLAVIGASGSGKSSLVLAGVLPALRGGRLPGSADWPVATMLPGNHPLEALAVALHGLAPDRSRNQLLDELRGSPLALRLEAQTLLQSCPRSARLVLIVDQFEEIFTLCHDEAERTAFLALLLAAAEPDGRCLAVITMRADFYPRVTEYPELAKEIENHQLLVGRLTPEGLRAAVEQPALKKGLQFEAGLVETILADVGADPGVLPLLQNALQALWERRHGNLLTLEGYRTSGGVAGAIAKRANAVFDGLSPKQQAIARRVLLRLTQPGETTEDTRRRADFAELVTRPDEADSVAQVVTTLVDARLLTTSADEAHDTAQVDVVHEALIRGWPRLQSWLQQDRQRLLVHRRLTEAAQEWQRAERDPDLLYRGARLAEASAAIPGELLNPLERDFLVASEALRERERAAAAAALAERERRRRQVVAGLAVFSLLALLLAGFAGLQWREAGRQTSLAVVAGEAAVVAKSTAEAEAVRADGQAVAARTAEAAAQAQATAAAIAQSTAVAEASRADTERSHAEDEARVSLSRQLAAQSRAHTADLDLGLLLAAEAYDLQPGDPEARRSLFATVHAQPRLSKLSYGHDGPITSLAFGADGKTLASGGRDGTIRLWDPVTGTPIGEPVMTGRRAVWSIAFQPGTPRLAAAGLDAIQFWDLPTGAAVGPEIVPARGVFEAVAFNADGTLLASATDEGVIELWDVATGARRGPVLEGHDGEILFLAFTSDGMRLISTGADDGTVRFWDVATGTAEGEPIETDQEGIANAALTADGALLATAGYDGTVRLWDVRSRQSIGDPLAGHDSGGASVAFSPDETTLFSAGDDGGILQWDVATRQLRGAPIAVGQGAIMSLALSPDGTIAATGGGDGTLRFWQTTSEGQLFASHAGSSEIAYAMAYRPDGEGIVTGHADGAVLLWNVADGSQVGAPLVGHTETVDILRVSPDGKTLATASSTSDDGIVQLWDMTAAAPRGTPLLTDQGTVTAVAFNPSGKIVATGGIHGSVLLWRVKNRALIGEPIETVAPVSAIDFNPDGTALATTTFFGAVQLWRAESGEPMLAEPIETGQGFIYAVCFVRNGTGLVTAGDDGTIRYWNAADGSPVGPPVQAHEGPVKRLACDQNGSRLLSSGGDGQILLWTVPSATPNAVLLEKNDEGWQEIAFSPDGSQIAFTSQATPDRYVINLWDITDRVVTRSFPIMDVLLDVELSPDSLRLVAGGADSHVRVWDAASGSQIATLTVPGDSEIGTVAPGPDGSSVALGSADGTVRLWDPASSNAAELGPGPHHDWLSALAFNTDGTMLASGAEDGTVQLWDTATRDPAGDSFVFTNPLNEEADFAGSLAFSADGSLLAVAGTRSIGLWDIDAAAWAGPFLEAHSGNVEDLAFSPDGQLLASAGDDGLVGLWDIQSRRSTAMLSFDATGGSGALAFSPDGRYLVLGQWSGTVLVWELTNGVASSLGAVELESILSVAVTWSAQQEVNVLTIVDEYGTITTLELSAESWRQQACAIANRNLTREEWDTFLPGQEYKPTCPDLPEPASLAAPTASGEGVSAVATPVPPGGRV